MSQKNMKWFFSWMCIYFLVSLFLPASAMAKTGGIEIKLKTYGVNATGKRVPYKKAYDLLPNERTPYIIAIENKESSCWVRVKVEYCTSDRQIVIDDSWLAGIDTRDWIKCGDYWYFLKPLQTGESVDFCKEIQVPDLDNIPEAVTFQIISKAEAVQSDHVTPDFDKINPFAGLMIDSSTAEKGEIDADEFEIQYENGADNIVDVTNMFHDVQGMVPGDVKTGNIKVTNSNSYKIRVILKETGSIDDLMLKTMKMAITKDGNTLYEGSLIDNVLKNGLSIGDFLAGSEKTVQFKVWLPWESGNETAFRNIKVRWVFDVERIGGSSGNSGESSESGSFMETPAIYSLPDGSVRAGYRGGRWNLIDENKHLWEYILADGTRAANGWMYLYNPYSGDVEKSSWFCFDSEGFMRYGWIKIENGNWYFCHEVSDGNLGKLMKGWHHDADDKRTYYLDPITGIMQSGWREINGNYYYFATINDIPKQNWFWESGIGRWVYDLLGCRTYGSMYRNEQTPDGYSVNTSGIWDRKEKQGGRH